MSAFYVLRLIDVATDYTQRRVSNNAFPHELTEKQKNEKVRIGALEHDQAHLYAISPNGVEYWEASCHQGCEPVPALEDSR